MGLLRRRGDRRDEAIDMADEVERRLLRQTIEAAQRRLAEIERAREELARRRADDADAARYRTEMDLRRPRNDEGTDG